LAGETLLSVYYSSIASGGTFHMGWMDGLYADLLVLCSHIKRSFLFERPIRFFCLAVLVHASPLVTRCLSCVDEVMPARWSITKHYNDHLGVSRCLAPNVGRPVVSLWDMHVLDGLHGWSRCAGIYAALWRCLTWEDTIWQRCVAMHQGLACAWVLSSSHRRCDFERRQCFSCGGWHSGSTSTI